MLPLDPEPAMAYRRGWRRSTRQSLLRWMCGIAAAALLFNLVFIGIPGRGKPQPEQPPDGSANALQDFSTPDGRRLQSPFARWVHADFTQRWNVSGITRGLVEAVWSEGQCQGEKLWVQIINGTLWIHGTGLEAHPKADGQRHERSTDGRVTSSPRPQQGWYPAPLGAGWTSAKGRVPYTILALIDVLRTYPGQVPNVDFVVQVGDQPCRALPPDASTPVPPIFSYDSTDGFADIPFPDYSYWGHEHDRMLDETGSYIIGWEAQFQYIAGNISSALPLDRRRPAVMWRGRASEQPRDALRRAFTACPEQLKADSALFNLWQPDVKLHEACQWRYLIYLESEAWATNFKQKLACGSVNFAVQPRYYEFFARALVPGLHYIQLQPETMCAQAAAEIKRMERVFQDADSSGSSGTKKQRGKKRSVEAPDGADAVGEPDPWSVAVAGQEFLRQNVRMEDVRRYIIDALLMYASRQGYEPVPPPGAVCYSGNLLLEQFGWPYEGDRRIVANAYPWLADFAPPCHRQ